MSSPHALFTGNPSSRRIAAFGASLFPLVHQEFAYELVRDLGDRIDAEVRFVHAEPADPGDGQGRQMRWLGLGLLAPMTIEMMRADLAHFRDVDPARVDALLQLLARELGMNVAEVAALPVVGLAISQARWVKALAPDLICTFYNHEGALAGFVAAFLLGLPRVHFHYPTERNDTPQERLLTELLLRAAWVTTASEAVATELGRQFGPEFAAKTICQTTVPNWPRVLAAGVQQVLARQPSAASRADLGAKAAFVTTASKLPIYPADPIPFVVLGAERTGSNLLSDMLLTHPGVLSAGELFNPDMIDKGQLDIQMPAGIKAEEIQALRRADPAACHALLLRVAKQKGCKAAGFKLLYYHAMAENRIVDRLVSLPNLRVIHLRREDRLARWVSHERARRSDSWWVAADGSSPERPKVGAVELSPHLTLWDFEWQQQLEQRARATFADSRWLELSYEQLAADLHGVADLVQDFLGIERRRLEVVSVKQGERDARSLVQNYEALSAVFEGSRWGHVFQRD
ncbi:MAG: sulfotransferase [Planctomycetes bacterium]|jgi:LPS sulfotransferase NodH|nr:sulfotransferase [Planctomycetota bacterium]